MPTNEPITARGWGLFAHWHDLIDRGDPRFSLLAPLAEVDAALARVEASVCRSMWNMQRRFYEHAWEAAVPAVPNGDDPPFTPRMVQIATRLAEGATDREIARRLGVSERTVSADVREMSTRLGARSRAHAIALISGVDG